ncbi:MAG: hypothetical protein FJ257_12775 [Phycisphaerae bacterium]|nr:hypothetical protein [Phycisphaerae bacterium]
MPRPGRTTGTRSFAVGSVLVAVASSWAVEPPAAPGDPTAPASGSSSAAPAAIETPPLPAGSAEAISLLDQVERAFGGRAAIDAIPGVRMEMTVATREGDPDPVRISVVRARPFAARIRQSGGGRADGEIGFDGDEGWMSDGRGGFLSLDPAHARGMLEGADLQAMLRDLRSRFERIDLDPPTEFRGAQALVLRCIEHDAEQGESVRIFVDPGTALPLGMESITAEDAEGSRVRVEGWRREGEIRVFERMVIDRGGAESFVNFTSIRFEAIPAGEIRSPLGDALQSPTPSDAGGPETDARR